MKKVDVLPENCFFEKTRFSRFFLFR